MTRGFYPRRGLRYSARSVASGLFRRTSRLETTPMAATRTRREHDAADVLAGEDPPRDVERVAADAPRQRDRAERPDEARERAQHAVFEQQHLGDRPRVGAERLEDGGLVDALELRHRHGADQNQRAAEQHQAADDGDGERDLGHHVADRSAESRESRSPTRSGKRSTRSCWKRARAAAIVRPLERRDEGLRRLIEDARPEHEHEAAVARIPPLHVADARDPRVTTRPRMSKRIVSPTLI